MYTTIWNKYLPVIKILLKKAVVSDQVLKINATDFERATNTKKANTKFTIESSNGKFPNAIKYHPAAKEFISVLLQDASAKEFLQQHDVAMILTTKYELTIRHIAKLVDAENQTEEVQALS